MHHHLTNQERALNNSICCQSSCYLALVSFPVLSQIKPQAPLLVCPPVNSFKFQPCDHTPPEAHTLTRFLSRCWRSLFSITKCNWNNSIKHKVFCVFLFQSLVGIVYSWDYDGIWSSSIPQLSFLITWRHLCGMLSLLSIFHRSQDFTPRYEI